jgi:hypothetical protein
MVRSLGDSSSDVRQAAAYGLGLAGALGGEQFAGACAQAIPLLFAIANHPDARTEDNVLASENAVSAIGKICHFNSSQFDVNQVSDGLFMLFRQSQLPTFCFAIRC